MNCAVLPMAMVSMAQNRSLPEVLHAVVAGIAQCSGVVLARIWLIREGDICDSCRFREACPDQSRCLHLVASAGNPNLEGADYSRLDGAYRRFPLGVRKIGQVGLSGEPLILSDVDRKPEWLGDPDWAARESVRTFAAQPLVFRDETLGALGIFDRGALKPEDIEWLRVFADHAAVSIANARAFEEIERLKARLEDENDYLRREVSDALGAHGIVGTSEGMKKVRQQIDLVAPTDAAALITGESGTGKELVARAIHSQSARRDRALIKVNCGAIPENLFESEFFGHVKGAFTGAVKDRAGRFELADGGSLFLDEVGELPLAMQAKLLRVIQEKEYERVGDTRTRKVDARLIAATNRDLLREVEAGRFRQDLFYRLSVFPVEIPPLRDRREDIDALASHFLRQGSLRLNRPPPALSAAQRKRLRAYDWPGNARELQNVIERAVIVSQGGPVRVDVPIAAAAESGLGPAPQEEETSGTVKTRSELRRQERANIEAALRQTGGKVFGPNGAAELLGMRPTTLSSRIKALGLRRKPEEKAV